MDPKRRARLLRLRAAALAKTEALRAPEPPMGERLLQGAGDIAGGINEGILGTLDLFSQPVTLPLQMMGVDVETQPFTALGRMLGGVPQPEDRTAGTRFGNPIGSALIPGMAMERAAATTLPHLAGPVLRGLQQVPGAFRGAEALSAVGAGTGAEMGQRAGAEMGEALGGVAGALAPAGVMSGVRGLLRGGEAGRQQFAAAAEEARGVGVQPSVGEAGSRVGAALEAASGRFPIAAGMRERHGQAVTEAAQAEAERIARGPMGTIQPEASDTALGGRVVQGINEFVDRWDNRVDSLYGELRQQLGDNPQMRVSNALRRLEELATPDPGMARTSGSRIPKRIKEDYENLVQDAAEGGGYVPYESVRKLRSQIGRVIGAPTLHPGEPMDELRSVYAALREDMRTAAEEAGPDALAAFDRANAEFGRGITFIEKRLQPMVNTGEIRGRPENLIQQFRAAARKGSSAVRDMRRALTPSQFDELRSDMVSELGVATPGQQGAEGSRFNVGTFLTNWNRLAPEAKSAMFGGSGVKWSNWRRDLDRLARVSERIKDAAATAANPSGTAQGLISSAATAAPGALLGGALAGDVTSVLPAAATLLGALGSAATAQKAMMSPAFVRWLSRTTQVPLTQWPSRVAQLTGVVADETDEDIQEAILDFQAQVEALTEQLAERPRGEAPLLSPYSVPAAPVVPPPPAMNFAPGPQSQAPGIWDDLDTSVFARPLLG